MQTLWREGTPVMHEKEELAKDLYKGYVTYRYNNYRMVMPKWEYCRRDIKDIIRDAADKLWHLRFDETVGEPRSSQMAAIAQSALLPPTSF